LINGNFYEENEEKEEKAIETPFLELLAESKRLPEAVILLKVSEENFFKRKFD